MPLHLISGRANAGKSGVAYAHLRNAVEAGRQAILVLPTMPDVIRARRELANSVPLGLAVSTFQALVSSLWGEWGDGSVVRGAAYRTLALSALAESLGVRGGLVPLAAQSVQAVVDTAGLSWRAEPGRVPAVGSELARLMRAYALHLGETGSLELPEAALELARGAARVEGTVVFHRFTDLSPWEIELIVGLARSAEVFVTLSWEAGFAPTALLNSLVNGIAWNTHEEVSAVSFHTEAPLAALSDALFTERVVASEERVFLCLADGFDAEARGVVAEVVRALEEGAARGPESVAVSYRDLRAHRQALRRAFEAAAIPAQFDVPVPVASTALGSSLLDALRFAGEQRRASLLNLLRSPFSGVDPSAAQALERSWRRRAVDEPRTMVRELRPQSPALASAIERISARRHGALGPDDAMRVAQLARLLLANAHAAHGEVGAHAREDAAAQRACVELLDDLAAAGRVSPSLAALTDALALASIRPLPDELAGHVQVLPVSRLRGRRFDVVVLGGLNAGEFPAPAGETALPGSALESVIRAFGGQTVRAEGDLFDRALFYDAVTRARRRLVLSACRTDDDGETLGLSWLFEEVAERLGARGELSVDRHTRLFAEPDPEAHDQRERARSAAARSASEDPAARAARARADRHPGTRAVIGALSGESVSPSQLEAYLRCPYRWFYQYVLRPQALERGFDARDEGEIAHRLLASTYRTLIDEGAVPLDPTSIGRALELLDSLAAQERTAGSVSLSLAERVGMGRAVSWARRVLESDASSSTEFAPQLIEWSFGDEQPLDVGGIPLRGRVDRVDVARDGRAIVIDYKRTCSPAHAAVKMLPEGRIQLALYLEAVREYAGLEPRAVLYRGLANNDVRGAALSECAEGLPLKRTDVMDADQLAELVDGALLLAREALEGMRAGQVPARPRTDSACAGCPVGPVCTARRRP